MTKNKINKETELVNQKNSIIALKRMFYLFSRNSSLFERKQEDNGAINYQIATPLGDKIVNNCPFSVPTVFAPNAALKEKKDVERKKPSEKYPQLYKEALNGEITNATLRKTLSVWVKQLGNVCIKDINGFSFFESNAKGTNRYNKRNYWKIHDFCKEQDKFGKKAYFCTFTCQNSVKKDNIIAKWKQFSDELNLILKKLSESCGVEYVGVKESFLSGFPHAHVIFYVRDYDKTEKQRYLRTKKYSVVVSGKIKELLNKYFTMGYTELVRNTKKGTANYLSKYISKNETTGLKHLVNKKKWNNSDRKQILTTFMPIIANVRQFQKSVYISPIRGEKIHFENFLSSGRKAENGAEKIIERSLFLSDTDFFKKCRDSDYLITLCNNLPKCIQKQVCILSNKRLWKFTSTPISELGKESSEMQEAIFKKSCALTCSGCVYAHFLAELLTKKDEWFNNQKQNSFIPKNMSNSVVAKVLANMDKEDNNSMYSKEIETFMSKDKSCYIENVERMNKTIEARNKIEIMVLNVKNRIKKETEERQELKRKLATLDKLYECIYDVFKSGAKQEFIKEEAENGTEPMLF